MTLLIIPIGPPGSGKTFLRFQLRDYCLKNDLGFLDTNRDEIFKEIRKKNSLKQSRRILYDKLMEFYKESRKDKYNIIYIDSVNGSKNIRDKFIESIKPNKIIFINFIIGIENIEYLLKNTKNRTRHPTFPKNIIEQENIIKKILPKIEYEKVDNEINKKIIDWDLIKNGHLDLIYNLIPVIKK